MIRGHIVRDDGATKIPRDFADQTAVDEARAAGHVVELDEEAPAAAPEAEPPAAAKAKKAAPAAKKARK